MAKKTDPALESTQKPVELGLDTFGDVEVDAAGEKVPYPQVIRNVVEQAVLADQVGVDFFGIGEHHRDDFAISSPEVVLGAIASRTERIHLGTAVTVLSSDDPVRVYEKFATLDAVSNGRAEMILGAGRSPSRSRCSGSTCRTTRSCSRRSSTYSPSCSTRARSPGRARSGRR